MSGFKKFIINFLGVLTTAVTLLVIYFILYLTGVIRQLTSEVIIEYLVMLFLSILTKSFWYISIEHSFRTSKQYEETEGAVVDTMNTIVEDSYDFDEFIRNENIENYNRYILQHCRGITAENYKYRMRDNIERVFRFIFHHRKDREYYAKRYIHRIEHKARKLHQLSSANILTFSNSANGLTDDRRSGTKLKVFYIIGGSLLSAVFTFVTAMIGFTTKEDVDVRAATIKMIMYSVQIIMSVLQTILQASANTKKSDIEYFRKIENILEKYKTYKDNPKKSQYIQYNIREVNNATVDNTTVKNSAE